MGNPLRELFAIFDIKVPTEELEKGEGAINELVEKVKKAGKVFAEAFAVYEVKEFFEHTIEAAAHVQDLAQRLDVSADALSTFGNVAASAGIQFDQAANLLGLLQRNIAGGAGTGKGNAAAKTFALLGISAKDAAGNVKPVFQLLGDVAEAFTKVTDHNKKAAYAMQIFGRQGRALLPLLDGGREKVEELTKEYDKLGHGLGDDYYKRAKEAREESEKVGIAIGSIKDRITSAALPAIMWLVEHVKDLVVWFLEFTKKTYIVETALRFLGVVIAAKMIPVIYALARSVLTATAPMLPWIAAATAAYLVFDDLFTLVQGGQSVIGEAFDKAEGAGAAADIAHDLSETWDSIVDAVRLAGEAIGLFASSEGKDMSAAAESASGLVEIFRLVLAVVRSITGAVQALAGSIKAAILTAEAAWEGRSRALGGNGKGGDYTKATQAEVDVGEGVDRSIDAVKDILDPSRARGRRRRAAAVGGTIANPTEAEANLSEAYGVRETAPLPGGVGHTTNVVQHNQTHVDVHNVKDNPEAVGAAAGQGVETAQQKANRNALFTRNNP